MLLAVAPFLWPLGCKAHDDPAQVIGLYSVPASHCSLVAAAGFTVVHDYAFETRTWTAAAYIEAARDYMDEAHRWRLRVLLGIPRDWARRRDEDSLVRAIGALSTHPALLAWYEEEMFLNNDLASVEFMHGIVGEHDPGHGLIIEESKPNVRLQSLGRDRIFTWYPVTAAARRRGRMISIEKRFPVHSLSRPAWISLQAFGRDTIVGWDGDDFVEPNWPELQYCLYASVVAGLPHVFFYSYLQPTRYDASRTASGAWPWTDYEPLSERPGGLWSTTQRAVQQWRVLGTTIGSSRRQPLPEIEAHTMLVGARWSSPSGDLVVIANRASRPLTLEVDGARWKQSRTLLPTGWSRPREINGRQVAVEVPGPGGVVLLLE